MNKRQKKKNKKKFWQIEFVHYGANTFDPALVPNGSPHYKKPSGLWASPTKGDWNWKEFCLSEEFHLDRLSKHFKFTVKKSAKILVVNHLSNLKGYISHDYETLNREKLYRHYDGMMVWMGDNWHELHNNFLFWMWDVDSIVIWNPDVIILK